MRTKIMSVMAILALTGFVLQSHPKISKQQAEKIALQEIKGGKILSGEYEKEAGKEIWSFDIKVGKGIKEVWVDPQTGKVIKVENESPAHESREK
ncbi:MAG: PepSY domain-containing protein [Candidatus Kryptoniota bacterium]